MSKRVVIAAGGTGGHLFPAQSLAAQLIASSCDTKILFVAKGLSTNRRFNSALYQYKDISSGPITANLKTLVLSSWSILKGIFQSIAALRKFKPDVVIGFGSYHSFPVLCAARILGISIVLHEANSVPGKVNRIFSPYAAWTGVFFPEAAKYLKGKTQTTDLPLRKQFLPPSRPDRKSALEYYGLQDTEQTVLVFGGSLGAKKLNDLAAYSICLLKKKIDLQVLHFTGSADSSQAVRAVYDAAKITAVVRDFEHEMQYAWAAADLCLCRSGASTIAEAVSFGVPAIFVPYPFATDAHQDKNAEYVTQNIGGSVWFHEASLNVESLAEAIDRLLLQPRHNAMKEALAKACQNMQQNQFSDFVVEYLKEKL